jgi:hypothetical protein
MLFFYIYIILQQKRVPDIAYYAVGNQLLLLL